VKIRNILIVITVVVGLFVSLKIVSSVFFKRSLIGPKSVVTSTGCIGWKRTGLMNKEENDLFSKLEEACTKRDLKTMNQIIDIPKKSIRFTCRPLKQRFLEPENPVLEISIKNTSNKSINFLEPSWQRLTLRSGTCNNTWTDMFDLNVNDNPRWIKILKPQETYTFTKELFVEGYGKHEIELSYSVGVWDEITEMQRERRGTVIDRTTSQFYWEVSPKK
jgi:hypothetical protein